MIRIASLIQTDRIVTVGNIRQWIQIRILLWTNAFYHWSAWDEDSKLKIMIHYSYSTAYSLQSTAYSITNVNQQTNWQTDKHVKEVVSVSALAH